MALLTSYGYFVGTPKASWNDNDSWMTMLEDFEYIDKTGKSWVAPKGVEIDGASIPRVFWSLIGGTPYTGRIRRPAVVHDCQCVIQTEAWYDVHNMFYWACKAARVSEVISKTSYYAVYHFGPRWIEGKRIASSPQPPIEAVNEIAQFIRKKNPTLETIRRM